MGIIKKCALYFCDSILFSGIIMMIVPEGNLKKLLKIIMSLFILCTMIMPLHNLSLDNIKAFEPSIPTLKESSDLLSKNVEQMILKESEKKLKKMVQEILSTENIICKSILVNMDIKPNHSIVIKQLEICVNTTDEIEKAKNLIQKYIGIECKIQVENQEEKRRDNGMEKFK